MLEIDKCAYNSNLTNANPMIKVGVTFIFMAISLITNSIRLHLLIMLFVSMLIVFLAKVDIKLYIKCLKI
ncbi:MAG: hypothetical protein ACLVIU_13635, partial [Paraclostridium sp.]